MLKMLVYAVVFAIAAGPARAIGFATFSVPDPGNPPLFVALWYPSNDPEKPVKAGLDGFDAAAGGGVSGKDLKLIVFSHGQGGGFAEHVDTALALAKAGFVVASLTHTGDNFRDGTRVLKIWDRTRQLHLVTDWVLQDWAGHTQLDQKHIGVFGFSAGGFTALVAAGGVPDLGLIDGHCNAYPAEFVCGLIRQANAGNATLPQPPPGAWVHDPRIEAAVVAAPALGFTFGKAGLAGVHVPVQLWRAAHDTTLPQPFYAQAVADDLPRAPEYHVVPDAEHLDFISPCDKAKAAIVPAICQSLPGFDRAAFHEKFNAEVTRFFRDDLK